MFCLPWCDKITSTRCPEWDFSPVVAMGTLCCLLLHHIIITFQELFLSLSRRENHWLSSDWLTDWREEIGEASGNYTEFECARRRVKASVWVFVNWQTHRPPLPKKKKKRKRLHLKQSPKVVISLILVWTPHLTTRGLLVRYALHFVLSVGGDLHHFTSLIHNCVINPPC